MNKVILIGRITRDLETNGQGAYKFSLATDRMVNGTRTADFIPCTAFTKVGENIAKYCMKGSKIMVEGNIKTGQYTNRENKLVSSFEVIVERVEFLENKPKEPAQNPQNPYQNTGYNQGYSAPQNPQFQEPNFTNNGVNVGDDDLPF